MTISEFYKNYNLHDSLLESVRYDKEKEIVTLEIDFCYWQQTDYTDDKQETGIIRLIFSDVSEFDYTEYNINSDEIVDVELSTDTKIVFEVYNDVSEDYHTIIISANDVKVVEE